MKTNKLNLMIASFFLVVFSIGFINAASISISNINVPSSINQNGGSFEIIFNLTNQGQATDINWSLSSATTGTINSFSFSSNHINEGTSLQPTIQTVTATINFPTGQTGNIAGIINAGIINGSGDDKNFTFSVPITMPSNPEIPEDIKECSLIGNLGNNLKLTIEDISVIQGFGDDEDFWYPLDQIEVEIQVENKGDEKIRNIEVKWGLYNTNDEDWVFDEKENDFNLKDGDDKTLTINFKLDDPKDFRDGGNYIFYAWVTGEDGEFDDLDVCTYDSQEIDIIDDNDFVIVYNVELSKETAECDSSILFTADAWNVGDNDQDDVSVRLYNNELNIDEEVTIGDIRDFDKESFSIEIKIPQNAEEKTYALVLEILDEDKDIFENDEDDTARFNIPLKVKGNCDTEEIPKAIVSAGLESGGNAGEQLVIKTTIMNSGDESAIYTINVKDYTNWANLESISPEAIHLKAGESGEVLFTFNVDEDVSGDKTFDITLFTDNKEILSQPVQVPIKESKNSFAYFGENPLIMILIGLIILVLIIIIVILMTKKTSK